MNNPLVSIIIPTYNSLQYLEDSISSVLNQTYKNIEVILVDDGSTDGTKDNFVRFEKLGVKCFYQDNAGASAARNTGLDNSKGEYIQFLDADDLIHKDKISNQITLMLLEKSNLSFCRWSHFRESITDGKVYPFIYNQHLLNSGVEIIKSMGEYGWFIPIHSWMVKRDLINSVGIWNTNFSNNDDGEYFARVLLNSDKIVCSNNVHAFYRDLLESESLSKLSSEEKFISAFQSWIAIENLLFNKQDKALLVYPKRAYYSLFIQSYKDYEVISKSIANRFDKLNISNKYIVKFKVLNIFIKVLGLNLGYRLYFKLTRIKGSISI